MRREKRVNGESRMRKKGGREKKWSESRGERSEQWENRGRDRLRRDGECNERRDRGREGDRERREETVKKEAREREKGETE